jgi:hypothetical protein
MYQIDYHERFGRQLRRPICRAIVVRYEPLFLSVSLLSLYLEIYPLRRESSLVVLVVVPATGRQRAEHVEVQNRRIHHVII